MVPHKDIFLALNRAGIRYLVADGIALNLHQIIRATVDLDLIVQLEKKNVLNFVAAMSGLGYVPRVPVKAEEFADPLKRESWVADKNMTVFSFIHPSNPMEIVDVFVNEPIPFEPAFQKRKEVVEPRISRSCAPFDP